MLCAANTAVEQEVILSTVMTALFVFTRFWCSLH